VNLKELVQEVNSALDYNPDLQSYKNQVIRVLNGHYLEVSAQLAWTFLQKTVDLQVYAAVVGATGVTINVDATNRRLVTGVGTTFHSGMEGQYLTVNSVQRRIVHVASTTSLYVDSVLSTAEVSGSTSDWTINFTRYLLPDDCAEVLGIMDRVNNRGKIYFIDARKEEIEFLDADNGGDPIVSIEQPHEFSAAPSENNFRSTVSVGGSLTASTVYEYMYTVLEFGSESPPSIVVTATTTVTDFTVTLLGLVDTDYDGSNWSGRRINVYRRIQGSNERWMLIGQPTASATVFTDAGSFASNYESTPFEEQGYRQYMRFWYTPGSDLTLEIRYQSIPRRLQSDSDAPTWPKAYHRLLVYRTMQDACMQHGMTGQAAMWEARGEKLMVRMRQKHLSRIDRKHIRQGFDKHLWRYNDFGRWGTPVKS
jgi:hypothetical protein